jgi:hypothetical protein
MVLHQKDRLGASLSIVYNQAFRRQSLSTNFFRRRVEMGGRIIMDMAMEYLKDHLKDVAK